MIRKIATVVALAGVALTYSASAYADDFYAAPMNAGAPTNLPGERLIPGVEQSMELVNTVTRPILQPILVPGGAAPTQVAAAEPVHHHHHYHMHHHVVRKMPGANALH